MKAVIQRVRSAAVCVDGIVRGQCGHGLMILLGVASGDGEADAVALAEKIAKLRIFSDEAGKMNLSALDIGCGALVVSNFTLCANTRRGNRPDYFGAASPDMAEALYHSFIARLRGIMGEARVEEGVFGADMQIEMINDGPVTIIIDSGDLSVGGSRK